MSISLSGTLYRPIVGTPLANASIIFHAVNTVTDVVGFTDAVAVTNEQGAYSTEIYYGKYDILVRAGGVISVLARGVIVDEGTTASTLNDLVREGNELADLTPAIMVEFRSLKDDAQLALSDTVAAKNAALGYRDEAQSGSDIATAKAIAASQSEQSARITAESSGPYKIYKDRGRSSDPDQSANADLANLSNGQWIRVLSDETAMPPDTTWVYQVVAGAFVNGQPQNIDELIQATRTYGFLGGSLAAILADIQRTGRDGVFLTPDIGHRAGRILYRKHEGRAEILSDLSRFYPAGAFATPTEPAPARTVDVQFAPTLNSTSNPSIFVAGLDAAWSGGAPDALVYDQADGSFWPADDRPLSADYTSAVYVSSGSLVVQVFVPEGETPPTTLRVSVAYPVTTKTHDQRYVDPVNGSDNNDGMSRQTAMRTIPAAASDNPAVIWIAPGLYMNGEHMGNYAVPSDIAIRTLGGTAHFVSATERDYEWMTTGNPVIYKRITTGTAAGVVDFRYVDELGLPVTYRQFDNNAEVTANPGSFNAVDGSVFVHFIGDDPPDPNEVLHFHSSPMRFSANDTKLFLENIDFCGGSAGALSARDGTVDSMLTLHNCRMYGQHLYDGLQIKDIGLCIARDCVTTRNANDGFNYHALNGIAPNFIEENCVGFGNLGEATGNGSTAHEDCLGYRIGCDYANNAGPGIADVGEVKSVNVAIATTGNAGFENSTGITIRDTVEMWIDGITATDNDGPNIEVRDTAKLRYRDTQAVGGITDTNGTADIEKF